MNEQVEHDHQLNTDPLTSWLLFCQTSKEQVVVQSYMMFIDLEQFNKETHVCVCVQSSFSGRFFD